MIEVELRCTAGSACCPLCQTTSHRIHSRYIRIVTDLPWGGTPMVLRCSTRRFFCDNVDCQRRIFSEQVSGLALRRARRTPRLDQTLVQVGLECGGEPGRRLCAQLGIDTSGDTILRRLRAAPRPSANAGNIIGIDDFAFRRGQRYGTIVVDHESGEVIDLLPDRTSAEVEAWLLARTAMPTIVTRDRSGVYAKAITTAVPGAVQVADRWHLLVNCREALVRVLDRHHSLIADAMTAIAPKTSEPPGPDSAPLAENVLPVADVPAVLSPPPVSSKDRQQSIDRRAKRVARYEQVLELSRQGQSQRSIVRMLKISRRLVFKWLGADGFPERAKRHHCKQVDLYVEELRARWAAGDRNARALTRHIRTLGYTGGSDAVKRCVAPWRTPTERLRLCGSKPRPKTPIPPKLQRPSSDRLSWLLIKDDIDRRAGESTLLEELRKSCEPVRVATNLARAFGQAVRERDINALTAWMERASQPESTKEMNGFAVGLARHWPEVKAAVELPWSNGRTEGHVNRLKLIKRKMYGRAKLDLLRIRVLGSGP